MSKELDQTINTADIELELLESTYDFSLYDYIVNGEYKGEFEVQFDNDKFNGIILYSGFDTENEVGEFEWVEVNKLNSLYKVVRDRAIKDYA